MLYKVQEGCQNLNSFLSVMGLNLLHFKIVVTNSSLEHIGSSSTNGNSSL